MVALSTKNVNVLNEIANRFFDFFLLLLGSLLSCCGL